MKDIIVITDRHLLRLIEQEDSFDCMIFDSGINGFVFDDNICIETAEELIQKSSVVWHKGEK